MRYLFLPFTLPLAMSLSACAATPDATSAALKAESVETPTEVMSATTDPRMEALATEQRFAAWKEDFIRRAIAKGFAPDLLAATVGRAQINERALERDQTQPEFTRPVWAYIKSAASADRINKGRAELAEHEATFDELEKVFGVPREVLTAIWGLESSYGNILGTHDIIDSLATFAFEGRRTEFGEEQIFAALDLIQTGAVRAEQLKGSWAGAMGMTQFIPTTFRDYAVDFDRNGNTDLWTSEADALASAANYITRMKWKLGEPIMTEVILPDGFDYAEVETVRKTVGAWEALGVIPPGGQRWTDAIKPLEAKLLAPAGHRGPKVLVFKNFDVLKRYNNSTSYVMGIASLAEAFKGQSAIRAPWPEEDQPLSFIDKQRMQETLTELGYDTKGVDGMIGPATRAAIRAWQRDNGLPADGYVEQRLYQRIITPRR